MLLEMQPLLPISVATQSPKHHLLRARIALIISGVLVILLSLCGIFFTAEIATAIREISPGCTFRRLTGISCPGCGGTRAAGALLRGDISGACRYNLLLPISLLALLIEYIRLWLVNFTRYNRWGYSRIYIRFFIIYTWLVCIWFIVRNIFGI